jgi:glucose-6-phosphate 1-epimerase
VWNPWVEIAHSMADLGDEDYRRMLCVETTNAADDVVHLAPGGTWCLGAEYAVERD